jgi:hypothetical protein
MLARRESIQKLKASLAKPPPLRVYWHMMRDGERSQRKAQVQAFV